MNETKVYKILLDETEGEILNQRYVLIEAENEQNLKLKVEKRFKGKLVSFKETSMSPRGMKVEDMIDGENYKIISHDEYAYPTIVLQKKNARIFATFNYYDAEPPQKVSFNLKRVKDRLYIAGEIGDIPLEELTLANLETMSICVTEHMSGLMNFGERFDSAIKNLNKTAK